MVAYPFAAVAYETGDCPEIDDCVSIFDSCSSANCPGTDRQDCTDPNCLACYTKGDVCLDDAAQKCTDQASSDNPILGICPCFGIFPLTLVSVSLVFGVPVILRRKQ